jgi:tRNA(Ile)-lysidine synthase
MPTQEPSKFHALELQARNTIREFAMLAEGDHVLVAVSGGADSMALLHCLRRLSSKSNLTLTVAHLNHRIRDAEGDEDAGFVRKMSLDLGLPFISETIEVKQQALATQQNLEELARNLRYDFLRRTAAQIGATKIALGHNLNDQAETALFRYIRGSGIEGLSAIHPVVDGLIIRPLLACSRDLICDFLRQQNISYREDSTNTDLSYARNRIRQELLPYIQTHFNPQILSALSREASLARETWAFIESQTAMAYATLHSRTDEGISLKIPMILELHPALQKQVLRHALIECLGSIRGIGSVHIEGLLAHCKTASSGEEICLPHGGRAFRQFDTLLLLNHSPKPALEYAYTLAIPGQCYVAEASITFRCKTVDTPNPPMMRKNAAQQAFLDRDALPELLTIRSRLPGDRYGGQGHRKIKKMLIDSKMPLLKRSSLPMVAAGSDVVWVPGFQPAANYAAKSDSESCLMIEISHRC